MPGWKRWLSGELVDAATFQGLIQDQTVVTFASAAARTATGWTPHEGALSYLQDTNSYERWTGSAWRPLLSAEAGISAALGGAWTGVCTSYRVAGMLWVYVGVSTGNALANTSYDIGTFPVGSRPFGNVTGIPAAVSGVMGTFALSGAGILSVNTGTKHTSGATAVSGAFSVPLPGTLPTAVLLGDSGGD